MSLKRIMTLDELHNYLHAAMQLEHATIPPYLTALYSIQPGTNSAAFHVLRVVVVEEMLHLTLAANILNAVGGAPNLAREGFVPLYPAYLPDGETDFEVGLQRFSREAVETFLRIERPARSPEESQGLVRRQRVGRGLLPTFRAADDSELHFYSIGEFYQEISRGLTYLQEEKTKSGETLFSGDPARQITPDYYYSGGGEIIPVSNLETAQEAIRLISEQGEGFGKRIYDYEGELAHYYRFQQLVLGRYYRKGDAPDHPSGGPVDVDWDAVYPVKTNARLADYPQPSELHAAAVEFNAQYQGFLGRLTQAFSGQPELLLDAVGDMFRIRETVSRLMRNPIPGTSGLNAAPTFEMPLPTET
ncbi:MAG: ferritin-like protein [Candidatus Contendobacter sp.]|nr:ferritin-like protein [Candidatus Contendobacter sp.]MDS4059371.1 ferritin-like protein [Candidatus Contendobacter sp.]